jgi:dUTP pyrophosphatase
MDPKNSIAIKRGDRVAQLVIQRVENVRFVPVEQLPGTERGAGGFGSTGKK